MDVDDIDPSSIICRTSDTKTISDVNFRSKYFPLSLDDIEKIITKRLALLSLVSFDSGKQENPVYSTGNNPTEFLQ